MMYRVMGLVVAVVFGAVSLWELIPQGKQGIRVLSENELRKIVGGQTCKGYDPTTSCDTNPTYKCNNVANNCFKHKDTNMDECTADYCWTCLSNNMIKVCSPPAGGCTSGGAGTNPCGNTWSSLTCKWRDPYCSCAGAFPNTGKPCYNAAQGTGYSDCK